LPVIKENQGVIAMPVKKILVVDDSPTERHVLVELLTKGGYQVTTAENGEEGIAKAKSELPDLILMDVVMPGLNGYQATRTLTRDEKTKHIPVIVCTSKGQETDKIWGLRQGAQDYLAKPINGEELLAKIAAL
jgi:twitching motility two-component system response regulator PilH